MKMTDRFNDPEREAAKAPRVHREMKIEHRLPNRAERRARQRAGYNVPQRRNGQVGKP